MNPDENDPRFDVHECGQFRLALPGEQVTLLPLPDELMPTLEPDRDDVDE